MTALILLLAACGGAPAPSQPPAAGQAVVAAEPAPVEEVERLDVRALSFPAAWIAERVGGERVVVTNVLPAGEDPTSWQPPADLVASLAEADLVVANGAGFEGWLKTASLPERKLVLTADRLDLIEIETVTHSHGPGGEHSHTGIDPHTWSDPILFVEQAAVVKSALVHAAPAGAATFDANLQALERDLRRVDALLGAAVAPLRERAVAANHPAFNYLARRYGLDVTSFGFEPDHAPGKAELRRFRSWASGHTAPVLLWEATPTDAVKAAFPEGVVHLVIDPLEQPAGERYDYVDQARANARAFVRALRERPAR